MFAAAWPEVEQDRQRRARRRAGSGVTSATPDRRAGEMAGPRTDRRQLAQALPVAADDERPALEVLAAAGVTAGAEDPLEVRRRQRLGRERPDRPLGGDGPPDGVASVAVMAGRRDRSRFAGRARAASVAASIRSGGRVAPGRRDPDERPDARRVPRRSPRTWPRHRGSARRRSPRRSRRRPPGPAARRRPRSGTAPRPGGRSGSRRATNAGRRRSAGVSTGPAAGSPRRDCQRGLLQPGEMARTASPRPRSPWASRIGPR